MRILMCPPTEYKILWKINPWMNLKNQPEKQKMWQQWHHLFEIYQKLRFRVFFIQPGKGLADMVFMANAAWGRKGQFVISNFKHSQRQKETIHYKKWFNNYGFKTYSLPKGIFFEGQGDVVTLREAYLFGWGVRTCFEAKDIVKKYLNLKKPCISLKMTDPKFFHLDTCLFYLSPIDTILYFPGAFDKESQEKIKNLKANKIKVSEKEAMDFICNGIYYEDTIILNAANSKRIACLLKRKCLEIVRVDSSEFKKAGGGIRCLTLFLD